MRFYRDFASDLPEDLNVWVVLRKAPPLPFLPEAVDGTEIVILAAFYAGDMVDGERAAKPLRDFGNPIADVIGPHPFTGWQAAFDPLLTPGARNYWKSHNFTELPNELIDAALDYAGRLPSDQTEIFFGRLGGAVNEVARDATAYPHRDAEYVMNVHARWESAAEDDQCVAWAREYFDASAPYATGGVYANFVPDGESPLKALNGTPAVPRGSAPPYVDFYTGGRLAMASTAIGSAPSHVSPYGAVATGPPIASTAVASRPPMRQLPSFATLTPHVR